MFRFPWGDMHSLNLGWFLQKFNELREDWATAEENIDGALDAEIEKAEDALSDVFDARDAAAASATAAAGSATAAGTSATAAQNSATAAASSATLANQKATAAGLSEAAAAQSAAAAGNSATAAAGSATTAGQSATNAAGSATAAGQSATNAAASETAAGNSAAAAAASATAAGNSAINAEEAAESVEDSAQQIATNASDIINLKSAIDNKAPVIINNASGAIVKITDGANNMPVKDLTIAGVESANVTRTGKNLFDKSAITPNSWIIANTTTIEPNPNYFVSDYIPVEVGKPIICTSRAASRCIYYDEQKNPIAYFSWTQGSHTPFYSGYIRITDSNSNLDTLQVEYGSSLTNYEEYLGQTFLYPSETVKTLLGINNIWSDAGNINIAYCADTKIYIDKKIAELEATVLENIGG